MSQLRSFIMLVCLVATLGAHAQEVPTADTTAVKDTTSVVNDTTRSQASHELDALERKYNRQKEEQARIDSGKIAQAKIDSGKGANVKAVMAGYIAALASNDMRGRGYVDNGREIAAAYVLKKLKEFKLQPVVKNGPYAQGFAFPVNTFPELMDLSIDEKYLAPGIDYLIDASSSSFLKKT